MRLALIEKKLLTHNERNTLIELSALSLYGNEKRISSVKEFFREKYYSEDSENLYFLLYRDSQIIGVTVVKESSPISIIKLIAVSSNVQHSGYGMSMLQSVLTRRTQSKRVFIKTANPRTAGLVSKIGFNILEEDNTVRKVDQTLYEFVENIVINGSRVNHHSLASYPWIPSIQATTHPTGSRVTLLKEHPADRIVLIR